MGLHAGRIQIKRFADLCSAANENIMDLVCRCFSIWICFFLLYMSLCIGADCFDFVKHASILKSAAAGQPSSSGIMCGPVSGQNGFYFSLLRHKLYGLLLL